MRAGAGGAATTPADGGAFAAKAQRRGWVRRLIRTAVTAEAAALAGQALLAGQFINGNYPALAWHQVNGVVSVALGAVLLAAVTLGWWLADGPGWVPLVCGGLVAAEVVQLAAGFSRALALHVPLGVAIVVAGMLLLTWAWRTPPATPGRPSNLGCGTGANGGRAAAGPFGVGRS